MAQSWALSPGLGAARLPGPRPRRPHGRAPLHRKAKQLKSSRRCFADYMDRRVQAKYVAMNPTSKLEKQFFSRWVDLNHPCNNGDLIMFPSGGTIDIGGHIRRKG